MTLPHLDTARATDRYRAAAPIYDLATAVWTGGAIWRSRRAAVQAVTAGERIVVPGGGTGRAALAAARRGAQVVLVDRSQAMLERAQRRLESAPDARELRGRLALVRADAREWRPSEPVDGVLAAHFLNVFEPSEMRSVRGRLLDWLRPGGKLWIADFAPPRGAAPLRAAQRLAHVLPLGGCALLTGNAMHPIYDHGREIDPSRARLTKVEDSRVFRVGPRWFRTWTFEAARADARG